MRATAAAARRASSAPLSPSSTRTRRQRPEKCSPRRTSRPPGRWCARSGSRWRRRTAATWPSSAGTPTLPRGPSGSSWAGGEASRPSSPRSRTLRWRRRSDHWRSFTPKQDLQLRFHRMSRTRSSMTSVPQTPTCRFCFSTTFLVASHLNDEGEFGSNFYSDPNLYLHYIYCEYKLPSRKHVFGHKRIPARCTHKKRARNDGMVHARKPHSSGGQ